VARCRTEHSDRFAPIVSSDRTDRAVAHGRVEVVQPKPHAMSSLTSSWRHGRYWFRHLSSPTHQCCMFQTVADGTSFPGGALATVVVGVGSSLATSLNDLDRWLSRTLGEGCC
jgi:hypothetical protein